MKHGIFLASLIILLLSLRHCVGQYIQDYADQCLRPLVAMGDLVGNPLENKQHRRNRVFGSRDMLTV